MRILFHYHTPAKIKDGKVFMPAYLGLFVDSLAFHFNEFICLLHESSSSEIAMMDYEIKSDNVRLESLCTYTSIPKRYLKSQSTISRIKQLNKEADLVLIRASTPLLPFFKRFWKKPIILMLVSDATLGLENLPQPKWRKKMIMIWANWYANKELEVAKKSLTIVNSQFLYDSLKKEVKNMHLLRTTTLSKDDFFIREDTCQENQIRLLYAGRITKTKGILDVIEAMAHLREEGFNLHLDLVGMIDEKTGFLDEIKAKCDAFQMAGLVKYIGYRTAGEQLLKEYRTADVFVIASQASSEGFPRTLWEAMASSLPIVATSVSSIPTFTKGCAELAEPKNVKDYINKLRIVLTNEQRRKEMISLGLKLAEENTLEKQGKRLAELIKQVDPKPI